VWPGNEQPAQLEPDASAGTSNQNSGDGSPLLAAPKQAHESLRTVSQPTEHCHEPAQNGTLWQERILPWLRLSRRKHPKSYHEIQPGLCLAQRLT